MAKLEGIQFVPTRPAGSDIGKCTMVSRRSVGTAPSPHPSLVRYAQHAGSNSRGAVGLPLESATTYCEEGIAAVTWVVALEPLKYSTPPVTRSWWLVVRSGRRYAPWCWWRMRGRDTRYSSCTACLPFPTDRCVANLSFPIFAQ